MNAHRVDQLIKYALAFAGQEERDNRELGAIHLVKHVYLADLAYADRHGGETFTGAPWRFHHFGPWSAEVHAEIEPVVAAVEADERRFSSPRYDGEAVRWALDNEALLRRLEDELPMEVCSAIAGAVRRFGSDTPSLLREVYLTRPMLRAAPEEYLDFTPDPVESLAATPTPATTAPPTPRQVRDQRDALRALRETVRRRLAEGEASVTGSDAADPPPRYDTIFLEGQQWLDSLVGEAVAPGASTLVVDDAVWKSRGRRDPDLS